VLQKSKWIPKSPEKNVEQNRWKMLVKDVSQRSMMVNGGGQRSLADVSSQR
jgi:hypothetical protein